MSRIVRCSICGGQCNPDQICMGCCRHPRERDRKAEADQARRQTEEWLSRKASRQTERETENAKAT